MGWSEEELIAAGYKIRNAQITNADLSTENYCCDFPITLRMNGLIMGHSLRSQKIENIVRNYNEQYTDILNQ